MVNNAAVEKATAVLELDRQIVGVKIVKSKAEFEQIEAKELIYPLAYCVAVKQATNGLALKMTRKCSGCGGSTRALGFTPPTESFYQGEAGFALGLYESPEVAKKVAQQMKICPSDTYGVIIKPLDQFEVDPDVVIMVGNSYQMMRIIQGYSYSFGLQANFNMLGNQAICEECTAYPLLTDQINVSMLCSGTRFLAKWKKTEIAVGIPFKKFAQVVDGIILTANAVEMIPRKREIQQKFMELGYDGSVIQFDNPYYLKLEYDKQKQRKEGN